MDLPATASVIAFNPYLLRALRRRAAVQERAAHYRPAQSSPAGTRSGTGPLRSGIRHTASGRMTMIHAELKTVLAMLTDRARRRYGLLANERLEAVALDPERRVFAGFWAR